MFSQRNTEPLRRQRKGPSPSFSFSRDRHKGIIAPLMASSAPSTDPRAYRGILIALLVVGAILRLYEITERSLWLDEMVTIQVAKRSFFTILTGGAFDNHTPPFYYALMHVVFKIAPIGEMTLRMVSAAFDLLNIVLLFFAATAQFNRRSALWAAALYAVSPFPIYFAQEGRMYPLLVSLCLITYLCALRVVRGELGRGLFFGLVVTGIAGLYTHYYFAIFVAALSLGVVVSVAAESEGSLRTRLLAKPTQWWVGAMCLVGLFFLPWVPVALKLAGSGGQGFRRFLWSVLPYTLLRFGAGYGVMPLTPTLKADLAQAVLDNLPLIGLFMGGFGLVALFATLNLLVHFRRESRLLLMALIGCPLLALIVSAKIPMLSERYLIVVFPLFVMMLGLLLSGAGRGSFERIGRASRPLVVFLTGMALVAHYRNPAFGFTDWRGAANVVRAQSPIGTPVVVNPEYGRPLVEYYLGAGWPLIAAPEKDVIPPEWSVVEERAKRGGTVMLVQELHIPSAADQLRAAGLHPCFEKKILFENGIEVVKFEPHERACAEGSAPIK